MVEAKLPDATGATCVSCDKKAVIVLVIKWRNWSTTTALCASCRKEVVKCLSPHPHSKKDLQTVWDLAREMSGESSYQARDAEGARLGVRVSIARALNHVKKAFGLRGKDVP